MTSLYRLPDVPAIFPNNMVFGTVVFRKVAFGVAVCTLCLVVVQICSLLRGGIGERGGVRVGHRIIEINGHSMVAMPHERIVHLLATSVGEVSEIS